MKSWQTPYKEHLSQYFGREVSVGLFWKGRVGLYAILRAMNIQEGDEVIIPAFTCVVVPNAIIYAGARPVYVDIEPQSFNMDPEKLKKAITGRTKVIMAQNTYGLPPDLDRIMEIAGEKDIPVIEDCTHGMGGTYRGRKNGLWTKAAFFSTQWNKPFSTGLGGITITRDNQLARAIAGYEHQAIAPGKKDQIILKTLVLARRNLLNEKTYWTAVNLYRALSRLNLVTGSSTAEELTTPRMPDGFLKGMSSPQAKLGIEQLSGLDEQNEHRKVTGSFYQAALEKSGITFPEVPREKEHIFLKFPLLVKQRSRFMAEAKKHKIELGDWFISPLHPVTGDLTPWGYDHGQFPYAEKASQHVVNLPTHSGIGINDARRVMDFVEERRDQIMDYGT